MGGEALGGIHVYMYLLWKLPGHTWAVYNVGKHQFSGVEAKDLMVSVLLVRIKTLNSHSASLRRGV